MRASDVAAHGFVHGEPVGRRVERADVRVARGPEGLRCSSGVHVGILPRASCNATLGAATSGRARERTACAGRARRPTSLLVEHAWSMSARQSRLAFSVSRTVPTSASTRARTRLRAIRCRTCGPRDQPRPALVPGAVGDRPGRHRPNSGCVLWRRLHRRRTRSRKCRRPRRTRPRTAS